MAKIAKLQHNGATFYPATIAEAILDPETGLPVNLSSSGGALNGAFTVNHKAQDENGNIQITPEDMNAAGITHTHEIEDVTNLQTALDGKSESDHTHAAVSGIKVTENGEPITNVVTLVPGNNVSMTQSGNTVTIEADAPAADTATAIADTASTEHTLFVGTQAEWDAYTKSDAVNYIVIII